MNQINAENTSNWDKQLIEVYSGGRLLFGCHGKIESIPNSTAVRIIDIFGNETTVYNAAVIVKKLPIKGGK